jgi:hypothetical protein
LLAPAFSRIDTMEVTRIILNEYDLSLKEFHSFDDLVAIIYLEADEITDRMRNHFMMEVFFE